MGFKEFLKKLGEATTTFVDNISRQEEWRRRVIIAKREILMRFTVDQLKQIAEAREISLYNYDPITGRREPLKTKGAIVRRIASNLTFSEVVNLAKRYKVKYSDIVQELEEYRKKLFGSTQSKEEQSKGIRDKRSEEEIIKDISGEESEELTKVEEVLKAIEEFTIPRPVKNENELQGRLFSWLAAKFGPDAVKEGYSFEHGEADIVVWDSIAIELKIARGKKELKNLLGEIQTDKNYFSSVITVVFDTSKNVGLDFFEKQIKALGAKAVIIPIQLRRKGKKWKEEIIIEKGGRRIIVR